MGITSSFLSRALLLWEIASWFLVLVPVAEVGLEKPEAEIVPCLAVADG
jgi:hypothetical protein